MRGLILHQLPLSAPDAFTIVSQDCLSPRHKSPTIRIAIKRWYEEWLWLNRPKIINDENAYATRSSCLKSNARWVLRSKTKNLGENSWVVSCNRYKRNILSNLLPTRWYQRHLKTNLRSCLKKATLPLSLAAQKLRLRPKLMMQQIL